MHRSRASAQLGRHQEEGTRWQLQECRQGLGGKEWQRAGEPELVDVHGFPGDAIGKAISCGIDDAADNSAFVAVGQDHDTAAFAVASIETWWRRMGLKRSPNARGIHISADSGGGLLSARRRRLRPG